MQAPAVERRALDGPQRAVVGDVEDGEAVAPPVGHEQMPGVRTDADARGRQEHRSRCPFPSCGPGDEGSRASAPSAKAANPATTLSASGSFRSAVPSFTYRYPMRPGASTGERLPRGMAPPARTATTRAIEAHRKARGRCPIFPTYDRRPVVVKTPRSDPTGRSEGKEAPTGRVSPAGELRGEGSAFERSPY